MSEMTKVRFKENSTSLVIYGQYKKCVSFHYRSNGTLEIRDKLKDPDTICLRVITDKRFQALKKEYQFNPD